MTHRAGRHFLQLPGPTNVPDRILRAMDRAIIDHRGPDFAELTHGVLERIQPVFGTSAPVFIFPSSGSGAWEAALVNTLSTGDRVLGFDQGFFADRWASVARAVGLEVETLPGDWRRRVDASALSERLANDTTHEIGAVLLVHNETSTGVTSDVATVRKAIDQADHPALLMVDAVSSIGATAFERDAWRVDVVVSGSQKGLMLPPGLSFNAVSDLALAASETAGLPRAYWDWRELARFNEAGFFPSTPATTLLYGLDEALHMLEEEGLENVFARHARHAGAARVAVEAWGLENFCADPAGFSNAGTSVLAPDGVDADDLRRTILERYDMSLGGGLGRLRGRVFRIGHLGDLNDLWLLGALGGIEMGLSACGYDPEASGLAAAAAHLKHAPETE